jgi:hypothetical protein
MRNAVDECEVENYHDLIPSIALPDPNGRHVLAAAIRSHSDVIVTYNLKHFPASELKKYSITAEHPDDFIYNQFGLDEAAVIICAHQCRKRLKKPPVSAGDYLARLQSLALPKTVSVLERYLTII